MPLGGTSALRVALDKILRAVAGIAEWGFAASSSRAAGIGSMRHMGINVIIEDMSGVKPIDYQAVARAFVDAISPDEGVLKHVDEIRAAISASRQRTPLDRVLRGRREDRQESKRRQIEEKIAELQRQLVELDAARGDR